MSATPYALALAAGLVAAVNPCGFALLPGYVSLVVADPRGRPGRPQTSAPPAGRAGWGGRLVALRRAAAMTAAMTGAFVAVFGLFGLAVTPLALSVGRLLPWATVVVGVGLAAVGAAMLAGWHGPRGRLPVPRLVRAVGGTLWSVAGYGVTYAVASLSCAIGPFLAVTTATFSSAGLFAGVAVFGCYAAGMGLVVAVVTVAGALARDGVARWLGRWRRHLDRLGRLLLLAAGGYVTYYGGYELRLLHAGPASDPVIAAATAVQGAISRWVDQTGAVRMLAALAALVALPLLAAGGRRWRWHARLTGGPGADELVRGMGDGHRREDAGPDPPTAADAPPG